MTVGPCAEAAFCEVCCCTADPGCGGTKTACCLSSARGTGGIRGRRRCRCCLGHCRMALLFLRALHTQHAMRSVLGTDHNVHQASMRRSADAVLRLASCCISTRTKRSTSSPLWTRGSWPRFGHYCGTTCLCADLSILPAGRAVRQPAACRLIWERYFTQHFGRLRQSSSTWAGPRPPESSAFGK